MWRKEGTEDINDNKVDFCEHIIATNLFWILIYIILNLQQKHFTKLILLQLNFSCENFRKFKQKKKN